MTGKKARCDEQGGHMTNSWGNGVGNLEADSCGCSSMENHEIKPRLWFIALSETLQNQLISSRGFGLDGCLQT